MHSALKSFIPIATAIERLLYPFAEIVIHDIKKNKIVVLYNSFSKRKINDPSSLSEINELLTLGDCTEPYEKMNWDGKKLKSISSLIKDEKGNAVGLFCINLDISKLVFCQELIANFIQDNSVFPQPTPLFKDDWKEKIHHYLHAYLSKHHLNLDSIDKIEKKKLVKHLNDAGAFNGKNAAQYVAQLLKISRATVYNYLTTT